MNKKPIHVLRNDTMEVVEYVFCFISKVMIVKRKTLSRIFSLLEVVRRQIVGGDRFDTRKNSSSSTRLIKKVRCVGLCARASSRSFLFLRALYSRNILLYRRRKNANRLKERRKRMAMRKRTPFRSKSQLMVH